MSKTNKVRPDWEKIRLRYSAEKIGLRQLARESGVSFSTLSKRCGRERWAAMGAEILAVTQSAALQAAERAGEAVGISASELEARTLATARKFLDRIDEELKQEKVNPSALRDLVATARTAIEMGRVVHRMDEPRAEQDSVFDIKVMNALAGAWLEGERALGAPISTQDQLEVQSKILQAQGLSQSAQ